MRISVAVAAIILAGSSSIAAASYKSCSLFLVSGKIEANLGALSAYLGVDEGVVAKLAGTDSDRSLSRRLFIEFVQRLDELRFTCDYSVACRLSAAIRSMRAAVQKACSEGAVELEADKVTLAAQLLTLTRIEDLEPAMPMASVTNPQSGFKDFKQWLELMMEANEIRTQDELARRLKITPSAISNQARSHDWPSRAVLERYTAFFGVPIPREAMEAWGEAAKGGI